MIRMVLRRVAIGIPVVFGVTVLVFLILNLLPGDPVAAALAGAPSSPSIIAHLREQLGLNRPLIDQYGRFLWGALHGNLGRSYSTNEPVTHMILSQLPATVELTLAAMALTAILGVGGGVLAALYRDTWVDNLLRMVSLLGTAMPLFWSGLLLLLIFSFDFHLFPATGTGGLSRLVLPALSLAFVACGVVIRLVRNSMIEVIGETFVVALQAKGIRYRTLIWRHALRNALVPAVTVIGVQIGALLSGAVITETVFARQGIGRLIVMAIESKDYPLVQGTILVIAVGYVAVNIVVDVSYSFIDPRVRTSIGAVK